MIIKRIPDEKLHVLRKNLNKNCSIENLIQELKVKKLRKLEQIKDEFVGLINVRLDPDQMVQVYKIEIRR